MLFLSKFLLLGVMVKNVIVGFLVGLIAFPLFAQTELQKAKQFAEAKRYSEARPLVLSVLKQSPKDVEALLLAGDIYAGLENADSALVYFKAAEKVRDEPNVLRKLAGGYSAVGKHSEAVEIARKLLKNNEKDAVNWLLLGEIYIASDSLTKADNAIRKAQNIDKNNVESYVALGDLYFAQKVYELAKTNYEEALQRNAELTASRIKLARTYYTLAIRAEGAESNELFKKSLEEWNIVGKKDSNNAAAFYEQGKIFYFAKQYGNVVRPLMRYYELRPDVQNIGRWYLAQSLFEAKKYDSAVVQLEILKKIPTLDSLYDRADSYLARAYFELKKYDLATKQYVVVKGKTKIDSDDSERLAIAAMKIKDTTTALSAYLDAYNQNPKKCRLAITLGSFLQEKREYTQAIGVYRKRLENCNDSLTSRIHYFIGLCFFSDNKVDSALVALKESLRLDSVNLYARIQLSKCYGEMKDAKAAKDELLKAVEIGKVKAEANKKPLGQAFGELSGMALEAKSFGELRKYASEWVGIDAESSTSHLYLAIAFQGLDDKDGACREYKEVLKRDAQNKVAKQNRQALGCN